MHNLDKWRIKLVTMGNALYSSSDIDRFYLTRKKRWRRLISIVKLATIVEGDPKAPFSIATTPRCRGGRYSIVDYNNLKIWGTHKKRAAASNNDVNIRINSKAKKKKKKKKKIQKT